MTKCGDCTILQANSYCTADIACPAEGNLTIASYSSVTTLAHIRFQASCKHLQLLYLLVLLCLQGCLRLACQLNIPCGRCNVKPEHTVRSCLVPVLVTDTLTTLD